MAAGTAGVGDGEDDEESGHRQEHEHGEDEPGHGEDQHPRRRGPDATLLQHRAHPGALGEAIEELAPDVLQLHGNETPEEVRRLRGAVKQDVEIWKAMAVTSADDLSRAAEYEAADRILLDAKPPKGATRTGGFGAPFDWSILESWRAPKPWILSGGLTPDTVAKAIAQTGAAAVDVSSGVESAPGVKDPARIRAFIEAAHR